MAVTGVLSDPCCFRRVSAIIYSLHRLWMVQALMYMADVGKRLIPHADCTSWHDIYTIKNLPAVKLYLNSPRIHWVRIHGVNR